MPTGFEVLNEEAVRRHIAYKVAMRELSPVVADRMVARINAGEPCDYRTLWIASVRVPLPPIAYHSSPLEVREKIEREGLQARLPADRKPAGLTAHFALAGQPRGVYLAPEPDLFGKWSLSMDWTIWEVDTAGLEWVHDDLNVGCWSVPTDIGPERLTVFRPSRASAST